MKKLILALAILVLPSIALAHPGGRDAYGGHYDSSTGAYHVHEGPLAGRTYKSQENMLNVLRQTKGGPAIIKRAEAGGNTPAPKTTQQKSAAQKQKKDEGEESIAEILLRELLKGQGR